MACQKFSNARSPRAFAAEGTIEHTFQNDIVHTQRERQTDTDRHTDTQRHEPPRAWALVK